MELFDYTTLDQLAFKAINQSGYGKDIDRYIYSQSGEGLGSIFGNMFKTVVPLLGKAIKGAAKAAAPHAKKAVKAAGKDLFKRGVEHLSERGTEEIVKVIHKPHKRQKRSKGL